MSHTTIRVDHVRYSESLIRTKKERHCGYRRAFLLFLDLGFNWVMDEHDKKGHLYQGLTDYWLG